MDFLRQRVSIHGTSIAYTDEGSGPTILLLHGAPTTSYVYRHVITHLRHSFRCIAPDFPGWGDSTPLTDRKPTLPVLADVTTAFVEALDLDEVTMCVMDTAGAPGIRTVQHIPDRFSGLVIADTFVFPTRE